MALSALLLTASLVAPPAPQAPPQRVQVSATATVTIISADPINVADGKGKADRQRRLRDGMPLVEFY
jgi:hypothetical protein